MTEQPQRPQLNDVTLVAVTSVALAPTVASLEACIRQCEFANVLLLSDRRPNEADDEIEWREIGRLDSRQDYSRFMLRDLAPHIETSHALCVQWDGFVLDGRAWQAEFLEYDYIGAVWPQFTDNNNVGNGGFSLRSRRLLEATRDLPTSGSDAEDIVIGRRFRPQLEARGIRFAPEEIARRFAFERTKRTGHEFGFHGAFNLVRYLPKADAAELFRSLEPAMLAPNERSELLRWALVRGRLDLALSLFARPSSR